MAVGAPCRPPAVLSESSRTENQESHPRTVRKPAEAVGGDRRELIQN
jgi:hypothetical protein